MGTGKCGYFGTDDYVTTDDKLVVADKLDSLYLEDRIPMNSVNVRPVICIPNTSNLLTHLYNHRNLKWHFGKSLYEDDKKDKHEDQPLAVVHCSEDESVSDDNIGSNSNVHTLLLLAKCLVKARKITRKKTS